ncbi:MAG: hypothetical protein HYR59_01135 [Acidobacteria bacterium]|nr:hypothetical protein [Acidobacteriota bacterium]
MPEIFRTAPVKITSESAVVVIHCSDPRYQPHFQDFLNAGLKLERYALIAVPGGAHFLTLVDYLPKFSWVGWRWLKFVHDVARAERLILIGHDECRWYLDMRFGHDARRLRERVIEDLRCVRTGITERFPHLRVELFFARLGGDHATIESV